MHEQKPIEQKQIDECDPCKLLSGIDPHIYIIIKYKFFSYIIFIEFFDHQVYTNNHILKFNTRLYLYSLIISGENLFNFSFSNKFELQFLFLSNCTKISLLETQGINPLTAYVCFLLNGSTYTYTHYWGTIDFFPQNIYL